jgi:hypothetical protein
LSRRRRRYIFFFAAILAGLALGIIYGWVINPVVYRNTGMDTLRLDYKTDYVLMVAELYQSEGDLASALTRIAYIEASSPLAFVTTCIDYAEQHDYTREDIDLMWSLASDIDNALRTEN